MQTIDSFKITIDGTNYYYLPDIENKEKEFRRIEKDNMVKKIEGIEPVGKKVLVEVITKAPELTSALITLNEDNTDTDRCNVLNIGTEVDLVEEGKTYIYRLGAGVKLTYKDVGYLLLDEKDFYAKIAV